MKLVVVLRTRDMAAVRAFYESVGLSFTEEQHGTGPRHLAADAGGWVLEIYPAREHDPGGLVELGFEGAKAAIDPDGRRLLGMR